MIRAAAAEYNGAEYKFYQHGFFKFIREGAHAVLIEDIYIIPEFRGTPAASIMLGEIEQHLRSLNVAVYYGRVFKGSKSYEKRIRTFEKWGMTTTHIDDTYSIVVGRL